MLHKKSEKGQALVLIAFAAVGLFAFTALSVDGGRVFSDKRHAQNAADTAALAAALARVRAQTNPDAAAVASGEARAISNGYNNDTDSTVEINICDEPGIVCEGLPNNAVLSDYIRVKITSIVRTTFARIIGWQQVVNVVTAVSKAQLGGPSPVFDGSALVALAPTGSPTIQSHSNINLDINNSGVFDNSTDGCAFSAAGNSAIDAEHGYTIAGGGTSCVDNNAMSGNVLNPAMFGSGTQIAYPPELNIPVPSINCSGTGVVTNDATPGHFTVHPGNYGAKTFNNGIYTFMAGTYCFSGGLSIGGNATVTANYVDIKLTGGAFKVDGNANLNCNYILVHIAGGSGINVGGNSDLVCNNATFFASIGSVSLGGNGSINLTAPTAGSHGEYRNLLIYMPYGNGSALDIAGNSGTQMTGSIIGISAPVYLSGNSGTTGFHCSITGYTIEIRDGSNTIINYVPEEQFTVLDPSAIGLTK